MSTTMGRGAWKVFAMVVAVSALPAAAQAQVDDRSRFGVVASFSPPSDYWDRFKVLVDAEEVDIRSRDVEVGLIVRGRTLGGDWGVSYFQRSYEDGSMTDDTEEFCDGFFGCAIYGDRKVLQDVELRGVSIHKFVPFATIKRRAQIGLNFAGGVAQVKGTIVREEFGGPQRDVFVVDAKELFLEELDPLPIWKVEVMGTAIVGAGVKVRAAFGVNFTNFPAASIGVSYLFGSQ